MIGREARFKQECRGSARNRESGQRQQGRGQPPLPAQADEPDQQAESTPGEEDGDVANHFAKGYMLRAGEEYPQRKRACEQEQRTLHGRFTPLSQFVGYRQVTQSTNGLHTPSTDGLRAHIFCRHFHTHN